MKSTQLPVVFMVLLVTSSPIAAQNSADWEEWPTGDRWRIGAGYFAPDLDTKVVVTDSSGNLGTGISFEQNLGLSDNEGTGMLFVDWRFFKRHAVSYRYFELKRSATTNSSVSIRVGEEVFDVNLPITSFFDITAHEISYSYSLLFDQKKELFVGAGISIQDLALGIQGTESSPDPGEIINSTLASTAPLPTLNMGFDYAFSDKWLFQSRLGWLVVELDFAADEDLSGEIINANVGILWKAFENVSFFANYQVFHVDVEYVDAGAKFAVDYNYKGPVLGVSVNF